MRPDNKPEGLRQSMSWLHTWSGLVLGWLLYAVFFTGTLSYFLDEVNTWMRPELHRSVPVPDTAERAVAAMQQIAPGASTWTLNLPGARQTTVDASWRMPGAATGRAGQQRAQLDAGTGEVIVPRETRGGSFLYRFHFELYAMPRVWARWIVGIATMFMFVAILSGVVTHKKIFSEFFTFRPKKGQRSWLDAHNATAVLALPFHVMITFSGLLLFMMMLLPWGTQAVYKNETRAFVGEFRSGGATAVAPASGEAREGREGRGARRAEDTGPVSLASVAPMMALAEARWPEHGVGSITVQNPGTARATIELRQGGSEILGGRNASERLLFDGVTGEARSLPPPREVSTASALYHWLTAPHLAHFAGPALRWLLFLGGVLGTVMAGTGMVLWVVKRLPERRKLGRTPHGHRLVEVLNVAALAGLSVAVAGYFWANRVLPAGMEGRADAEIAVFFWVWAGCALHAVLRAHRRAWLEQMALAALAFALLPLLNAWTGGAPLPVAMANGQWSVAGFDLVVLFLGAAHGFIAWKLRGDAAVLPARRAAGGGAGGGAGVAQPVPQAKEKSL